MNQKIKITPSVKPGVRQKMRFILPLSFLLLLAISLTIYFQLSNVKYIHAAAAVGDYRSAASGNWSTAGTWQKCTVAGTPGTWATATTAPNSTNGVITIQSGHIVTVTAAVTVDQVVISAGGEVDLNSAITLTIANGTGTDWDVFGTYKSAGTTTLNASATAVFEAGGTYIHNQNGGTVLTATWNATSTAQITGLTTTYPSGLGQTFGHLTFNSAMTGNIEVTSNISIAGNLTVAGTGAKILYLTNSATGRTITTGGDFNISGGVLTIANSTGTGTVTVPGNFNISAGTFTLKSGAGAAALNVTGNINITGGAFNTRTTSTTSTAIITVAGNFNQSGGTMDLSAVAAVGTLNVAGNFSQTGGTLTESSTGSGSIIFNKSGTQIYTSGGTISNTINFTVSSGSTLDMGTSVISGGGTFTLSSGGGLIIGDPNGITSSGATGNIQVTGTRTYNTGASYTYDATSAQNTGNGLPATVTNLTLNNSNGLTLTSTTNVSSTLTLTSGKIITGANEIQVVNSSSIVGYSTANYIVGKLRMTVTGTGTYNFPVGSASNYELIAVTLNSTTGFTTLLGLFTNADPINPSYPLTGVTIAGASIDTLLDYGYWTLTPNSAITGGSYDVSASEKGYSNVISSVNYYPILIRANSTSSWQEGANDQACKYTSGTLTANKTGLTSFGDLAIGYGLAPPIFAFDNHTLISGTDMQVGAVYLVSNIGIGLDAWIQVTDFTNGASISDVDNWTVGNGYNDAWQPFINAAANKTSSVGWKIMFKVGGTSTDTVIPNIVFAAIDVDGDGASLREFVTAYNPTSISYSASSQLVITQSGQDFTATANTPASFSSIDTNNVAAMFKVTYKNVSNFLYRTGVINGGGTQVRQASLYFKSFNDLPVTQLPIELIYFTPKLNSYQVDLTWVTASETNNNYFTVERSSDGVDFEEILRKPGAGNSTTMLYYSAIDANPLKGMNYYRLKQTDFDGKYTYSSVKEVKNGAMITDNILIETIGPNPFTNYFNLKFTSVKSGDMEIQILNNSGQLVYKEFTPAVKGNNYYSFSDKINLPAGIYFVKLLSGDSNITETLIKK